MALSAGSKISRLARFCLITADANNLATFYEEAFGCRRSASEHLSGPDFQDLFCVAGGALRITLRLGASIIDLLQFEERGRPYPRDLSASDLDFQHFAIMTKDIDLAHARLRTSRDWRAISRDGPQHLPASSGGVTAFKFRDPEGHPLELLTFAQGKEPAQWQSDPVGENCLGIDHSAISVADGAASIAFYEGLGLALSTRGTNQGVEQDRLDDLAKAHVEVIALKPAQATPHLEPLCYRGEPAKRVPVGNADIAATRLVYEGRDVARAFAVTDPDGHRSLIVPPGWENFSR